ncbi:MAG: hypothetical protein ACI9BW_000216 [Gammaproteobacteria bacterium]|jgi:hypothetical protein
MNHKQFVSLLVLMLGFATGACANSSRLTVFNEVLNTTPDVQTTYSVYLSRLGTYYAELYLEPDEQPAGRPQSAVDLAVTVSFVRRAKILFSREVTVRFSPEKNVATLFFIESPHHLPQRKGLDMTVKFHHPDPSHLGLVDRVRLQLTRKLQVGPLKI